MRTKTINIAGGRHRYCPGCEHVTVRTGTLTAVDLHPCGHCGAAQTVALTPELLHAFAGEIVAHESAQAEIDTLRARLAAADSLTASLRTSHADMQLAIRSIGRSLHDDLTRERQARQEALGVLVSPAS